MALVKTGITFDAFRDEFVRMNREDQFSYEELRALYDYLDDEELGDVEFDVIGICCEFSGYESINEALEAYSVDNIDDLRDNTLVLETDGESVVVHDY